MFGNDDDNSVGGNDTCDGGSNDSPNGNDDGTCPSENGGISPTCDDGGTCCPISSDNGTCCPTDDNGGDGTFCSITTDDDDDDGGGGSGNDCGFFCPITTTDDDDDGTRCPTVDVDDSNNGGDGNTPIGLTLLTITLYILLEPTRNNFINSLLVKTFEYFIYILIRKASCFFLTFLLWRDDDDDNAISLYSYKIFSASFILPTAI